MALLAAASAVAAQRPQTTAPHEQGRAAAPAPIVWPPPPLPPGPIDIETAEERHVRITVVTTGLEQPWSLAFLPDGVMLVTERAGRLRVIRNGTLDPRPSPASRRCTSAALAACRG